MDLAMDGGQWAWLIATVLTAGVLIGLHVHLDNVARRDREENEDAS